MLSYGMDKRFLRRLGGDAEEVVYIQEQAEVSRLGHMAAVMADAGDCRDVSSEDRRFGGLAGVAPSLAGSGCHLA